MSKRAARNTRSRIVSAAWELFYENGYDDTTVDDIVERSGTSKGSFYHYFAGKDALLSSLSTLFDEKYQELVPNMDPGLSAFDQLIYLNLVTTSEKHLMDQSRYYFRILRKICTDGQRSGQLRQDISINEMVRTYALQERALLYDWCICGGNYSLSVYATSLLPNLLGYFKN